MIFDQNPKWNIWPFEKIFLLQQKTFVFFIWIYFVRRNKICLLFRRKEKTHDLCPGTLKIKIIIDTIYINTDDKKKSWHQKEDNRALIYFFFCYHYTFCSLHFFCRFYFNDKIWESFIALGNYCDLVRFYTLRCFRFSARLLIAGTFGRVFAEFERLAVFLLVPVIT